MADESAQRTETAQADIERRIRALERPALEVQPPSAPDSRQPGELEQAAESRRDSGGSISGLLWLLVGLVLIGGGLLQYMSRLMVWSGFWVAGGQLPVGLLFIPFVLGIALALAGGRVLRILGAVLVAASVVAIFGASLRSTGIFFRPTPLIDVVAMLALIGIGLGLVVRGVKRL